MNDLPGRRAPPGDRQHVAERLGQEHGVTVQPLADELIELAAIAPGGLVQVVGGQQDGARPPEQPESRSARRASTAAAIPPFMSEAPLPVSRPSSIRGGANGRWTVSRWPLNCSVGPGLAALEPDRHGRSRRVAARGPVDLEPVGFENLRQAVGGRFRSPGRARHLDQRLRRLEETPPVDVRLHAFEHCWIRIHEHRLYPRRDDLSSRANVFGSDCDHTHVAHLSRLKTF